MLQVVTSRAQGSHGAVVFRWVKYGGFPERDAHMLETGPSSSSSGCRSSRSSRNSNSKTPPSSAQTPTTYFDIHRGELSLLRLPLIHTGLQLDL
jgi:hypothetical protein